MCLFQNFIEQNPHWEINWIKDREKAIERCGKVKQHSGSKLPTDVPLLSEKLVNHPHPSTKTKYDFHLESSLSKDKKKKKKTKKRKKRSSSASSSSSSSTDSSSEEDNKSKSIRVAMRNKMRMQAQMILKEEMEGKLEALSKLVEDDRRQKEKEKLKETEDRQKLSETSKVEDNIINQWMTVTNTNSDKQLLEGLKGRLKQRQELEKERAEQAAAEQRKQERLREERKLKEIRERELREKEERDREERERREKERFRRREHSSSTSPEKRRHSRSRSRSSERYSFKRNYRRNDRRQSPIPYKPKGDDEKNIYESHFEKQAAESAKKKAALNKKLPFIGRMPLLKKKRAETDQTDKNQKGKKPKNDDYEVRLTKFEPLGSVAAFIPPPGVVHLPRIVAPPIQPNQTNKMSAENPPPPPKFIPEPPKISEDNEESEEAPPPPNITQPEADENEMQAPPPAPEIDTKQKGNLPRDFQDALNIIYPSNQPPDIAQDPNLMMQYQYYGYPAYPEMQMHYDYTVQDQMMSNDGNNAPLVMPLQIPEAPPPPTVQDDDLAMLGIDAGDMAAQTI